MVGRRPVNSKKDCRTMLFLGEIAPMSIDIRRAAHGLVLGLAAAFAAPHFALAQATFNPYADARYEYDSNVFRAQSAQANLIAIGDSTLADKDLRSVVGVDGTYLWSEQKLTATLEGRRYNYDHFTNLDHNEYLADVALKWKTTSLLDGILEARQEQLMAPFAIGNSTQLTIDVDRKISGTLDLNINPDWRLESGVYSHNLKAPLQDFPDFTEREVGTQLALVNRSITHLTYGISLDHISGRFENAPSVGSYDQTDAQLTVNYTVSALSTFKGAVGYTKRQQAGDSLSGITGLLGYTRQLTVKTSVAFNATRTVNSYVAAGGSEIDTGATATVSWQATYRVGVSLSGGYTHSAFVGQFVPGSPGSITAGRVDNSPEGSLNVNYQVLRNVKLRAYLNRQSRSSDVDLYTCNDTTVGIEARVSLR
jgi:Putative beta-barrel porin 2